MNNGTARDEQSCQVDCFVEQSASIAAKVEHDCLSACIFHLNNDFFDVGGNASNYAIALAVDFFGSVERGNVDNSDWYC